MLPILELAAKRRAQLYGYLEAIGQRLDLTETQYERARTSYEAVGAWLMEADSPHLREGSISPHGSIRTQTANRPFARSEFDVDLLDVILGISDRESPAAVSALVGDRLKEHGYYREIIVQKNRCWRLQYEGEMHLDVTPAILNPRCSNGGLLVPDKALRVWKPTHPIAFADRFEARARLQPLYRAVKFAEARADMEGLLERQKYKGPLKRGVQLCKRHRDISPAVVFRYTSVQIRPRVIALGMTLWHPNVFPLVSQAERVRTTLWRTPDRISWLTEKHSRAAGVSTTCLGGLTAKRSLAMAGRVM